MNRVDEDRRGRKVRCEECDARISVPADDDDLPQRRCAVNNGGTGMMLAIVLGGGAILLVLVMGLAVIAAYFMAQRGGRDRRGPNPDLIARGPMVHDQAGMLTPDDPIDPTPNLAQEGSRMKVHRVPMQPGKTYVINMTSDQFDAYLRVESPFGGRLAEDDDGGDDLNARIVFRPTEPGEYRIIATSCDGGMGAYRLTVQVAD